MKSELYKSHFRFIVIFMIFLCGVSITLTVWAVRRTRIVHASQTYNEIFDIKRTFLKNTVQNMISTIDRMYYFHWRSADIYRRRLFEDIERIYSYNPSQFSVRAGQFLSSSRYGDSLLVSLSDTRDNTTLFTIGQKPGLLAETRFFGPYALSIETSDAWIDERTESAIREIIYQQQFENGGYIWVNEIRNWDGGKDYAIRRIHANLRDTEGTLLSTDTTDIAGNTPYLTELEGVRDNGEVFFTYFFQRLNSEERGEKLTYAALYSRYNWIVAMGYYLDDVRVYIDRVKSESDRITGIIIFFTILSNCALFLLAFFLLTRLEKRFLTRTKKEITEESNTDPLTGAFNRRLGMIFLQDAFRSFRETGSVPALFMIDIDDFKPVNNRWGHACGDEVLKTTVHAIRSAMRSSDRLVRWGGEEFLLICSRTAPADAPDVGEKVRKAVAQAETTSCDSEINGSIRITISLGMGFFEDSDNSPESAVDRADHTLYIAKRAGKNCVR